MSCGGCITFTCSKRPCIDRDASKFKMFWSLSSVAKQCCQNCGGKIFPPNSPVSSIRLGDKCDTIEHAVSKMEGTVGTIEVSYTSGSCCLDDKTWFPADTNILEKDTCSSRTCVRGRPAMWDRQTIYQG